MSEDRLRKNDWIIRDVGRSIAIRLVRAHHYARGGSNTDTYMHGLFRRDAFWDEDCVGVAWWIPPTKTAAKALTDDWEGVLALSRLVVEPGIPKNAATFLMGRSIRMIDRERWPVLVTYADKWRGHTGTIYRAANWRDEGETKPEAVYTKNGRMIARKAGGHTRTHAEMLALGCVFEGRFSKRRFVLRAA